MYKENPDETVRVILTLIEYLGVIDSLFAPILPESSQKLAEHLGLEKPMQMSELKPFGKNIDLSKVKKEGLILYQRKE